MFDVVVEGGTVVTPEYEARMDVGIADGTIRSLAEPGGLDGAATTVDATDRLVFPGFLDSHVHAKLRLGEFETVDEFGDLTRAAAHGGTTTILPFAVPRVDETPLDALDRRRREADGDAYVDYGFHGCVTDVDDDTGRQVSGLVERGAGTVKGFMVYGDRLRLADGDLRSVMRAVADAGGAMLVHAENDEMITDLVERRTAAGDADYAAHPETHPPVTETAAMWTVLELVAETDCPTLLVHASSRGARHVARAAHRRDLPLLLESCPHYLVLDDDVYRREDGERYVCSPPVRGADHRHALWEMAERGLVSVVNSDHCGYTAAQKRANRDDVTRIPNGLPGVETCHTLLYSEGVANGPLSRGRFVELASTNVARALGLYPRKGSITVGADADLVVFDPERTWTLAAGSLHMAADYTPFEGREVMGAPETVLVGGESVVRDGSLVGAPDTGGFVPTAPGDDPAELAATDRRRPVDRQK